MKLRRGLWILFCFAMLAFAGALSAPVAQAHGGHAHGGHAHGHARATSEARAASDARQTQVRRVSPAAAPAERSAERAAHFLSDNFFEASAPAQICRMHCCDGAFSACCGLALIAPRLPEAPPKRSGALLAKSLLHEGVPPGALLDPPRS